MRYILRRNPQRAFEIAAVRMEKRQTVEQFVKTQNVYLLAHQRAHVSVATEKVRAKIKQLKIQAWLAVKAEGLAQLSTLCSMEMKIRGHGLCLRIPTPRQKSQKLLEALEVQLPSVLPHREVPVVTRKKLTTQRKCLKSRD